MEELAFSMASQWQKFGGVAALFVGREQFIFTFEELGEGHCRVNSPDLMTSDLMKSDLMTFWKYDI